MKSAIGAGADATASHRSALVEAVARRMPLSVPLVAVCVPVRDEQETLPALVGALAGQAGLDDMPVVACFLFDGCRDASERVVREAMAGTSLRLEIGRLPPRSDSNAGLARGAAMAIAIDGGLVADDGVLLSTDADSIPAPDWMATAIRALADVEVAAGRITRQGAAFDPLQNRVEAYYDDLYALRRRIDPVAWEPRSGHHFTSAANLGIRAAAYRTVGGFAVVPCGEDAAFIDDAARAGLRVRRDPSMLVETSARRIGRAIGGLATSLRRLDRDGAVSVGDPAAAVWQYERHAAARAAFARVADPQARATLGDRLGLGADHVLGVARDCPNAEAFAMRIVPAAPGADGRVSLEQAESMLAELSPPMEGRAA